MPTSTQQTKIDHAADAFIKTLLTPWLSGASPEQINDLRDRFKAYRSSHDQVRAATVELISLQDFARQQFNGLLTGRLSETTTIDHLEWLVVKPSLPSLSAPLWSILRPDYRREPGLLRLMQNFPQGVSYFEGTGLVAPGGFEVLSGDTNRLIADCRELDAGLQYQQLLDQVFSPHTLALLTADKRAGFLLAGQIALLKGQISAPVYSALLSVADVASEALSGRLHGSPVRISVLGRSLADVLVIEMHDAAGEAHGLVLYMPSDSIRAFRAFAGWQELTAALLADLKRPGYRQVFSQLVALRERAGFFVQLGKRLEDTRPDLSIGRQPVDGDAFSVLVAHQVQGVKDDAKLLLVPSALADAAAARARHEAWKSAGLGLAGLAGFFIPLVGAVLLGQLVVQVLSETFTGVEDWSHGHQHEALDHFLGVAETVAVTAAVAAGASVVARGFARSSAVDSLQPVTLQSGEKRLWSPDLTAYESVPADPELQADGLYRSGEQRWLRVGEAWYQVHKPEQYGPWRIVHPQRPEAYGPVVEHNAQRGWRLRQSRPLEWKDDARLLASLWSQDPPLTAAQVQQVLQTAGMDTDELRGLVVENRTLPVTLNETLRRFDAKRRIELFFTGLQDQRPVEDAQIEKWCLAQPGIAGLDATTQRLALLTRQASFRPGLFSHLSRSSLPDDPLRRLLQRDFPGLSDAYAEQALSEVESVQRSLMLTEQRVSFAVTRRARTLRQVERMSRAVEGLYFDSLHGNDSADLAIALLRRLPNWPTSLNIEVREGSSFGRRVAIMDPQGSEATLSILALSSGRYRLYDAQLRALDTTVEPPEGLFQALAALLSPEQVAALGITAQDVAAQLRETLLQQLPVSARRRLHLVGWRAETPWFNPGQRLADGRVGYLLSGRGRPSSASHRGLRERIRALYPGFNDERVERYLEHLAEATYSPFEMLLLQEDNYQRLDEALNRWEATETVASVRSSRLQMAARLRQCWRMQGEVESEGEGAEVGMRLDLSGFPVRELPEMPADVELSHVSVLVLRSMRLLEAPESFLRGFSHVRRLNLGSNELSRVPSALAYLVRLRTLNLDHNRIRLDPMGEAVLTGLPELSVLNLSYNPLGNLRLRFQYLSHLSWLSLRHCQLSDWPGGLDLCGFLETADLRDNQLSSVPEATLQMPLAYRRALLVERNPIPPAQLTELFSIAAHDRVHAGVSGSPTLTTTAEATQQLWLSRAGVEGRGEREERWSMLFGMPQSSGLFSLFGELQRTADFTQAPEHLTRQVWTLIDAVAGDADLREQVFRRANEPLTCEDSVAERFSDLQVLVLEAEANADAAYQERGARLITLGRRLFRLARVEAFARQDMVQRAQEGRGVDEIEVSLYYRVHLALALDLPLQPVSMHYGTVANVTEQQLEQALDYVRAAETREALAESLTQRAFWQRYLHLQHEQVQAELEDRFAEEGSQLDQLQETLSSEDYRQRWDDLRVRRETALHALRLQLTLDALDTLDSTAVRR